MGDVIKFGGRREQPANREKIKRPNLASKTLETANFLMALRESDPRSYEAENIAERREIFKELAWSDDALREEIMRGNKLTWTEKPSWYHAVLEELRERQRSSPRE
jgi:hypothetical protein